MLGHKVCHPGFDFEQVGHCLLLPAGQLRAVRRRAPAAVVGAWVDGAPTAAAAAQGKVTTCSRVV